MSSTDSRTVDPAVPHPSENGGHEMSDFSWTTVLWLIPIAVIGLVVFFGISIAWFKGAKDRELDEKQSVFQTSELNELHAKEGEILTSYKWVDKDKGRVQIPIDKAMELIAKEHQNSQGREWKPITDTYLEGAPFAALAASKEKEGPSSGISIDEVEAPKAKKGAKPAPAAKVKAAPAAEGQKAEERVKQTK
ncbi:MAG: hypothetical protein JWO30_1751 [Fibrobacteres bacterium]|nr:hypothetical protein [Fibrobacterota bacterium]